MVLVMMARLERFQYWDIDQKNTVWQDLHDYTRTPLLITGSSIPSILGYGYDSCNRMWQYFTGERKAQDDIDDFQKQLFEYGHYWEPFAAKAFMKAYPLWVGTQPGFLLDKEHDWLGVSLDYICVEDRSFLNLPTPSKLLNLEIKCRPLASIPIPTCINEVPAKHVIQCQIQMHVTGITDTCLFFFKEGRHSEWHIQKDDNFWNAIEPTLLEFKECVLQKRKPPRGGFKKLMGPHVKQLMQNLKPFQGAI
jgi:predicted phage-related endonuclease